MQIDLNGKRCAVLGLGISNLPLIDFLLAHGAVVSARDCKAIDKNDARIAAWRAHGVEFVTGEGYLDNLHADYIFRSPGIRPDLPSISAAVANGAVLTSEMELFFFLCPAKLFAVTGSDGKTTTTTLTYKLLEAEAQKTGREQRVFVGGNIGTPLLPCLGEMRACDFAVVELSSFQLMTMPSAAWAAAITNISPNHLNWHTDMDEYTQAKYRVLGNGTYRAVLNADNISSINAPLPRDAEQIVFSASKSPAELHGDINICIQDNYICVNGTRMLRVSDIRLPGRFNVENYMCAIGMTYGLVSAETVTALAKTFGGVEHRNEFVREVGSVRYYNSSIDSSPSRTVAALSAYSQPPILICGGRDKHVPFDTLADAVLTHAKALVLTGEAKEKILSACKHANGYTENFPIRVTDSFTDAVHTAHDLASPGDIVLLSPACTSFDAFKNFEERGKAFKNIINTFED